MFKNKKQQTENPDVEVASNVTMSPALAEIIERKKKGASAPAKKSKEKKVDLKDISDIPKDLLLLNRKPKIAPTISLIIDREIRDRAKEILYKDKRTMTEFVYSKLKELIDAEDSRING
jgi:hypothetical protein